MIGFLFGVFMVLFIVVCIILVFLVLIQSDKGGGISAAIGGGLASASSLLGTQDTANILTRGTTLFASLFMILCVLLSLGLSRGLAKGKTESILKKRAESQQSYSPSSILGQDGAVQEEQPIVPLEGEGATQPPVDAQGKK